MSLFSSIINQIVNKLNTNEFKKEEIIKELTSIINIQIKQDEIEIKNSIIFLNISPTIKTSVLLKKGFIIKHLERFNIKDIK